MYLGDILDAWTKQRPRMPETATCITCLTLCRASAALCLNVNLQLCKIGKESVRPRDANAECDWKKCSIKHVAP